MNKKLKVFVVGQALNYANWLEGTIVNDIKDADLVLFTGGADVYPQMYNEPVGKYTQYDVRRDAEELKVFEEAFNLNKYILGICRGAQFICVMNGGKLIQHQENRNHVHPLHIVPYADWLYHFDGVMMTSTHHQCQYPFDLPKGYWKMIATATESRFHLNGRGKEMLKGPEQEVEICYYPKTKALAIQGHPEMIYQKRGYETTFLFLNELMDRFINNQL